MNKLVRGFAAVSGYFNSPVGILRPTNFYVPNNTVLPASTTVFDTPRDALLGLLRKSFKSGRVPFDATLLEVSHTPIFISPVGLQPITSEYLSFVANALEVSEHEAHDVLTSNNKRPYLLQDCAPIKASYYGLVRHESVLRKVDDDSQTSLLSPGVDGAILRQFTAKKKDR